MQVLLDTFQRCQAPVWRLAPAAESASPLHRCIFWVKEMRLIENYVLQID